jgi:hypothetical protein
MNRLLLQLAATREIAQAPANFDPKTNRNVAGQKLVMDETQRLLSRYLDVERAASEYKHNTEDDVLLSKFTDLVKELLSGYQNMGVDSLKDMPWLSPILLGSCIQCKNEEIRLMVQKLVQGTAPGSTSPYPTPKTHIPAEGSEFLKNAATVDVDVKEGQQEVADVDNEDSGTAEGEPSAAEESNQENSDEGLQGYADDEGNGSAEGDSSAAEESSQESIDKVPQEVADVEGSGAVEGDSSAAEEKSRERIDKDLGDADDEASGIAEGDSSAAEDSSLESIDKGPQEADDVEGSGVVEGEAAEESSPENADKNREEADDEVDKDPQEVADVEDNGVAEGEAAEESSPENADENSEEAVGELAQGTTDEGFEPDETVDPTTDFPRPSESSTEDVKIPRVVDI